MTALAIRSDPDWEGLWESIAFTGISRGDLDLAREAYEARE